MRRYVLIDLKVDKPTHQDIGQMQMYVNYYDRYEKLDEEKLTIGILMCREANDAFVEITLPKDINMYAFQYKLYLPDKNYYRISSDNGLRRRNHGHNSYNRKTI